MTQTTASDNTGQVNTRAHDWAHFALGIILAVSPWLKNFSGGPTATKIALATGAIVVALAVVSLLRSVDWAIWGLVAAGVWAFAVPFILGLPSATLALKTFVIAGLLLVGSALWKMWKIRNPDKV